MNDLFEKAQQAMQGGKFDEALKYYTQAIAESPENASAKQGAALAFIKLERYDDAITLSKSALEIDARLPMPHVILAEAYDSQNKTAMSREEARMAFELDPNSSDVLACYGTFLLVDNKVDDAIPILEKSIEINPNLYNVYNNLIVAYESKRNIKAILTYAKKMYELRPSTHNAIRLGIIYLNSKYIIRVLSTIFVLVAVGAVIFEKWSWLIFPSLYIVLLIAVGLYLRAVSKKYR